MATSFKMTNARVFAVEQKGKVLVVTQSKKNQEEDKWERQYYRLLCVKSARDKSVDMVKGVKCTVSGFFGQNNWVDKHGQKRRDLDLIASSIEDVKYPDENQMVNTNQLKVDTNAAYTTDDIPF